MAQLTIEEFAHAASITDENPELAPLPADKIVRILIGSVIRKPPEVVSAWLRCLLWQQTRTNCQVDFSFVLNFAAEDTFANDSRSVLQGFKEEAEAAGHTVVWSDADCPSGDYGEGGKTRSWTSEAWHRVGACKNSIIQHALTENYDYLWLVDADVLCDPFTLQSLLDSADVERFLLDSTFYHGPIVSGVYWTFWSKRNADDAEIQHAGPQVWLRHPYCLDGRGYTVQSFRAALVGRQRLRVWGLGACTLIPRHALAKGCHFGSVGTLPPGGMSDGEDRHFCHRADALHLELVADSWPDIYHAYWGDEYEEIPQALERLERVQSGPPQLGDLVSLRLENLEVSTSTDVQFRRGRLGQLPLPPEVEEKLYSMSAGDSALVKAFFPVHYARKELANKSFVLRVTLYDTRPFGLAPTIDQELYIGTASKAIIDPTGLTESQTIEFSAAATS
ncbi:hypothetical protein LCGC14_2290410 [marine sediment metagenome]|uniref:Uncharacterized protein n=1 Tax=marine sediment metagenome TaxID=412755 RepID=A0A0F9CRZ4_9ZZZZ